MEENKPYQPYEDEITLKELILKIHEYWRELWKNWWLIGLITIPFLGYFLYKTFTHVPEYEAEVRFIVEGQGGSGSISGFGSILGSLGIRRQGGANPFKILEVARSKRMIGDVLLEKFSLTDELIANQIIDIYELSEKWGENNPDMANVRLRDIDIYDYSENERKAFLSLFTKTIGTKRSRENALLTITLDDESGIFNIRSLTKNEDLSFELSTKLYEQTKDFFEQQVLEDQLKSIEILKIKSDSIILEIDSKLRSIARFEDTSFGLVSKQGTITREKLRTEVEGLRNAYYEIEKSLQLADFEIQNIKPLFITIDQPYTPLRSTQQSLIFNIVLGIILGCFVGVTFILGRKIYFDTLS